MIKIKDMQYEKEEIKKSLNLNIEGLGRQIEGLKELKELEGLKKFDGKVINVKIKNYINDNVENLYFSDFKNRLNSNEIEFNFILKNRYINSVKDYCNGDIYIYFESLKNPNGKDRFMYDNFINSVNVEIDRVNKMINNYKQELKNLDMYLNEFLKLYNDLYNFKINKSYLFYDKINSFLKRYL